MRPSLDPSAVARGIRATGQTVQASFDLLANLIGNLEHLVTDVVRDSTEVALESQRLARMARRRAAEVQATIRAAPRFGRIVSEALRIVARYRLHAARTRALGPEATAGALAALHEDSARRIYQLCVELRGAILKLGQFLSARADILPRQYIEALSPLQDQVPPVPLAEIRARIEEELGRPVAELFAELEEQPIAAASLAQVHGARLPDGSRVVVKVQLPGLERLIEIDMAALKVIAGLLGELWPQLDWPTMVDELSRSITAELDFGAEAAAAEAFRRAFADDARVVVPRADGDRCSGRVLTLERIDGQRLTDFLDACAERDEAGASERDAVLSTLVSTYARQLLRDGFFQADPHPGNFLVLPAGDGGPPAPRLALLDFGAATELPPPRRRGYSQLAMAIFARDRDRIGSSLAELGFEVIDGDPDILREMAELLLDSLRPGVILAGAPIDPLAQLQQALLVLRGRARFRVPRDFVLIGRVFATLAGLLFRYRPGVPLYPLLASALRPG